MRGRNSDNRLIHEKLDWASSRTLREGLEITYSWIESQLRRNAGPYGRSAFSTKNSGVGYEGYFADQIGLARDALDSGNRSKAQVF